MSFSKYVVTNAGRDLLLSCMQTGDFRITRLVLGSGRYSGIMTEIADVVMPEMTFEGEALEISRREGQLDLRARLTNEQLESGFNWREYGVYASDGTREVLYCYDNAGEDAVPVSSLSSGSKVSTTIKIILTVSDAATVNVSFTPETEIFADAALSTNSENPVQNKVVTAALNEKAAANHTHAADDVLSSESVNPVQNKVVKAALDEKSPSNHTHSYNDLADKPEAVSGEDGGYYAPSVDADGNLTWAASKEGMPDAPGANIRGPQGESGAAGVTPVKGTDYFTEADKNELVELVLLALPAAEGVSF